MFPFNAKGIYDYVLIIFCILFILAIFIGAYFFWQSLNKDKFETPLFESGKTLSGEHFTKLAVERTNADKTSMVLYYVKEIGGSKVAIADFNNEHLDDIGIKNLKQNETGQYDFTMVIKSKEFEGTTDQNLLSSNSDINFMVFDVMVKANG